MAPEYKRNLAVALAALVLTLLGGCASAGGGRSGGAGGRIEPTAIAIANHTDQTFRSVALAEAVPGGLGGRVGRVEPLTRGSITTIQRQTNPKPLTDRVSVVWVTLDGEQHEQTVDIRRVLTADDAQAQGDTLLFVIADGVTVSLVWERDLNPFGP